MAQSLDCRRCYNRPSVSMRARSFTANRRLSITRVLPKNTATKSIVFAPAISTGCNVFCIDKLDIVDSRQWSLTDDLSHELPRSSLADFLPALATVRSALAKTVGLLPFFGVQILVARAARQAVFLPDSGHGDDVDVEIEIAHHPANDRQLLKIFLAEHGASGARMLNSFATTVHTPRKCPGRDLPSSVLDNEVSSTNVRAVGCINLVG